ncbi:MAG: AAA family ATPase [Kiloniellaceae bacterium]
MARRLLTQVNAPPPPTADPGRMTARDPNGQREAPSQAAHVTADQGEVARFLGDPAAHGAGVEAVERIDTHGAMVFLAGARAYKIKRAVRFPYMDFSTLERRQAACEREVALNRRTAPALYLGVEAIVRREDGSLAMGGAGEPMEWAVVMRRFDQDTLLDRMAEAGTLGLDHMRDLADAIAAFHDAAEPLAGDQAPGGGAAGLGVVIDENGSELAERPDLFPHDQAAALSAVARAALARVGPLLDKRLAAGYVRRCHGDLHLGNVCLIDGRPTIFDAIEFNDAIACIDVLYDLAFLLMDLEHRGLRAHGNTAFNRYLRHRDDLAGLAALPLFLSVRAAVRAKVSVSMAASQESAARIEGLQAQARRYFAAARRFLAPERPCLVAVGGLSGTGKTGVARALAPSLGRAPGAVHLRSDVVRKRRFGVHELTRLPSSAYTAAASKTVYGDLLAHARTALAAGQAVIVDAVFARAVERHDVAALAKDLGVGFAGLWLEAPERSLLDRVAKRTGDASDAGPEVVLHQLRLDPGPIDWRVIDAAGAPTATVAAAEAAIAQATRS